ncbi:recombinase family protein [Mesorhizobium sp.]|uniref:recombinase family protein n=1 Tax=Mesorhizobium sp. TaxID=1871066 RepID=UPI00257E51CC|nr:recombinase family protein [Mesorhizobium sp.]
MGRAAPNNLQQDALKRAGRTKMFEEKESGHGGNKRPAQERALAYLRPDDYLVVWKVDWLAFSARDD